MSKDYTICVASKDGTIIKGYKMNEKTIKILSAKYGQGLYRYKKSKSGKASFQVRLYSIIIYYIFNSIEFKGETSLNICRDFDGKEESIKSNLRHLLEFKLNIKIEDKFYFGKLDKKSIAHKYSRLMRMDSKNQMKTYVKISLEEIERFLKKISVPKDTTRVPQS